MPDVVHDFPIFVPLDRVFRAVSDPEELDQWWTDRSTGTPGPGHEYTLDFGPEYHWRAEVTTYEPRSRFELRVFDANPDWDDTRVGFELSAIDGGTHVRFHHSGWPTDNPHYRTSCYCWAMYLRVLKRYLEHGETVPYTKRLDV